jgi:hypothetical protein
MSSSQINGINNGTFAFGMTGIMLPESLNGPFGSIFFPLPNKIDHPATLTGGPQYNSKLMNAPQYNEKNFIDVSGFAFSNFGLNQAPVSNINSPLSILSPK